MTPLLEAAQDIQSFCLSQQWDFCIIGGIALLCWGEPRLTGAVDVTLLNGFGREDEFIRPLLSSHFTSRTKDAAEFAARNRVLLIESPQVFPIDIALGGLPFKAEMVARAGYFEFETGCSLKVCTAEDLIVQKLFAFRPRDLLDVETIVTRQAGRLDWDYVRDRLAPLAELKDQPEIMSTLSRLRSR